jgi:methionyl-tRNA formyltransferase
MKQDNTYVVATIRSWNINTYHEVISRYPGRWHLVTKPEDLTWRKIRKLKPRYIFFPHWSWMVPADILNRIPCVCFHETDLPMGRGGSPVQNLIASGAKATAITAFRMTEELDAGPVFLKRPLSLDGLAEEIFLRASRTVADMILEIIETEPAATKQLGKPTVFKRRKPEQSEISPRIKTLEELFDHLRMLDAEGYPRAFIRIGPFKIEFSKPALRVNCIEANVQITKSTVDEGKR